MRPDITEEHIQLSKAAARSMMTKIRWRDLSDLEHDSLMGLYLAWERWEGNVPFKAYAWKCMRWAMLRYANYEKNYQDKRGVPKYLSEELDENFEIGDTIADRVDFEALIEAKFTLEEVKNALLQESPRVRDVVLRTDTDDALAAKYGLKDGSTIAVSRKRFFRDFFAAQLEGREYVSTGRNPYKRRTRSPFIDVVED